MGLYDWEKSFMQKCRGLLERNSCLNAHQVSFIYQLLCATKQGFDLAVDCRSSQNCLCWAGRGTTVRTFPLEGLSSRNVSAKSTFSTVKIQFWWENKEEVLHFLAISAGIGILHNLI